MTERNQGGDRTPEEPPLEPGTTGRYIVTFDPEVTDQALYALGQIGVEPTITFEGAGEEVDAAQLADQEATIHYEGSGIVIAGAVSPEGFEQLRAAAEAAENPVTSVRPEYTYGLNGAI